MKTTDLATLNFGNIASHRKQLGLNQNRFWALFGATQSGGSHYEKGRGVPKPLAMLLLLYTSGTITESHLNWATHELQMNPTFKPE